MIQKKKIVYKIPIIGKCIKNRNDRIRSEHLSLQCEAENPIRQIEPDMRCDFLILNSLPLNDFDKIQFKNRYDYHIYRMYRQLFYALNVRTKEDVETLKEHTLTNYKGWEKFFVSMVKEYIININTLDSSIADDIYIKMFDDSMCAQNLSCTYDTSNIKAQPIALVSFNNKFEKCDKFKTIILFNNSDFIVTNVHGLSMYIECRHI
jgi:hypothetical protein